MDTSVWIEAARRDGDIACKVGLESLLEEYEAALTGPVRLEFLGGARRTERSRLEDYLASLPYLPVEEGDWKAAVRHAWSLRDAGLSLPWNDILIATVGLRVGIRVYARDAHFDAMERVLGLRPYRPGPGGTFAPDDRRGIPENH